MSAGSSLRTSTLYSARSRLRHRMEFDKAFPGARVRWARARHLTRTRTSTSTTIREENISIEPPLAVLGAELRQVAAATDPTATVASTIPAGVRLLQLLLAKAARFGQVARAASPPAMPLPTSDGVQFGANRVLQNRLPESAAVRCGAILVRPRHSWELLVPATAVAARSGAKDLLAVTVALPHNRPTVDRRGKPRCGRKGVAARGYHLAVLEAAEDRRGRTK